MRENFSYLLCSILKKYNQILEKKILFTFYLRENISKVWVRS